MQDYNTLIRCGIIHFPINLVKPPKPVIGKWIDKYTELAIKNFRDCHPEMGDNWIADETVLRIGGQNVWMYDIIDEKTRFLLATRIAYPCLRAK